MDAIPLQSKTKTVSPEELDFYEAMDRLVGNQFFQKLVARVERERETAIDDFVKRAAFQGSEKAEPVDQRLIDYKRGFWNGAIFAVTQIPKRGAKDWAKFMASDNIEESESS